MASSSSRDLSEVLEVPFPISADEAPRIVESHGFFYQANSKIGALVDDLYGKDSQRSATVADFKPMLQEDPRLSKIFDPYSEERLRAIPWGTTPEGYYAWNPGVDSGLVFYMVAPGSRFVICVGSHKLKLDPKRQVLMDIGLFKIPNTPLETYQKLTVDMEEGGVLIVHPGLSHRTAGFSIAFGGLPTAQASILRKAGHRSAQKSL